MNRWLTGYVILGLWWAFLSTTSAITVDPLPVEIERFEATWTHPDPIDHGLQWRQQPFALALSGGGYRAAVFHAGALDSIERLGLRPTHLSTVSGGSIIGSYYWRGGSPAEFRDAVANARFNLKRKTLTLPTTAMLLSPSYSRRDVQAKLLDEVLLEGARHRTRENGNQPLLAINATDLSHGLQLGFLENHVFITGPLTQLIHAGNADLAELSLAQRVAISGAFPVAFPSAGFQVTPNNARNETRQLLLVDGGIGDNSGYQLMRRLAKYGCEEPAIDEWCVADDSGTKLVSDGGAVFAIKPEMSTLGSLSQMFDVSLRLREAWLQNGRPKKRTEEQDEANATDDTTRVDLTARANVTVTPHSAFFSVKESFSYPGGVERLNEEGVGVGSISFDPLQYPLVILEALAALLPNGYDRQAFDTHLAAFSRFSSFHSNDKAATPTRRRLFSYNTHGMDKPSAYRSYEECLTSMPDDYPNPELCEAVGLRLLILDQLKADMWVFADTETLSDTFTSERAGAIYRAGQITVLMGWQSLLRSIGPPEWGEAMRNQRRLPLPLRETENANQE